MKFVCAFDSFKGSITSAGAARAAGEAVKKVFPNAQISSVEVADGGEGLVSAIHSMLGGKKIKSTVLSPIMKNTQAEWLMLENGQAAIEMAEASGLTLLTQNERNPLKTTTYGTGQLILEAINHGAKKIIIGIGGSATTDCGIGAASALGVKFYDKDGNATGICGEDMKNIAHIDMSECILNGRDIEIVAACDVSNPLFGKKGAAYVYGPQKGADDEGVKALDEGLVNVASVIKKDLATDVSQLSGAGAAGGLGAGLVAFMNAKLSPGIELMLDMINFDSVISDADMIFTGEGKTDEQTLNGKLPMGVAKRAMKLGIPVICVSGCIGQGAEKLYEFGIEGLFSIADGPMTLENSMENAYNLLSKTIESIAHMLKSFTK